MTSIKLCAALAAILAISGGAAMAQAYGGDQYTGPSGYGPPPPPPDQGYQPGDPQGYGPPPPPSADPSGANGYGAQSYPDQRDAYYARRDDYAARMDHYRSGQQLYQHQLRVYERARRDYDRQFGPGAYEHYYAEPPPPPGDYDGPR